ncbi:MAG: zinc ribbon domain-containing protein [Candidatus Latescibacteria bacterium]|jgi:putative FmdB family regulatory protein|nr:zinc ribbon domain-containing protein [Candidatus Latescibacterota bacterium]
MPTYEYKCTECGHEFELFQSMTEKPAKTCPECCGKVERLIGGGAGLIFKGSGFYTTDYRSDSYMKAKKAEKSGKSSSGTAKDSTKSTKKNSTGDSKKKVTADK